MYARGVVAGEIIAGPHVRASCARHLRDLKEGKKRGLRWDLAAATRVIGYFRTVLRLNGGDHEGKPFELHGSQAFIIGSIFGWKKGDKRRFKIAFIEQGKGNGKSPLAAGTGMYMTTADSEARAETYAAAVDKDQAGILFRDAVAMARQSPALASRLTFSGGVGREFNIAYLSTASFFRPISSESSGRGKSGFRPHCILLDEIHEHPTNAMVEWLLAGFKWRTQPLAFMITNSGVDRTSVCFEYHTYGTKVAAGEIEDDSFFSFICSLDEGEDPFVDEPDPELGYPRSWLKANPLLGVTIQPSYLEEQVRQAKGMPGKESIVRRLNFCEWVDAENPWIDGDLWRACEVEQSAQVTGRRCFLALDLSGKRDLTSLAAVWEAEDGSLDAQLWFWTPADTLLERKNLDRAPYDVWRDAGHLIAVPGRSIDYGYVAKFVAEQFAAESVHALAFDRYRIDDFIKELNALGIDHHLYEPGQPDGPGIRLVRHGQGFEGGAVEVDDLTGEPKPRRSLWMPGSITSLEDVIINKHIRVKRNPVLTWNSASAVVEQDAAGNKKWEKRKSTGRIDGIVALSMAVGAAAQFKKGCGSVYETRGLLTI